MRPSKRALQLLAAGCVGALALGGVQAQQQGGAGQQWSEGDFPPLPSETEPDPGVQAYGAGERGNGGQRAQSGRQGYSGQTGQGYGGYAGQTGQGYSGQTGQGYGGYAGQAAPGYGRPQGGGYGWAPGVPYGGYGGPGYGGPGYGGYYGDRRDGDDFFGGNPFTSMMPFGNDFFGSDEDRYRGRPGGSGYYPQGGYYPPAGYGGYGYPPAGGYGGGQPAAPYYGGGSRAPQTDGQGSQYAPQTPSAPKGRHRFGGQSGGGADRGGRAPEPGGDSAYPPLDYEEQLGGEEG